MKFKYFFITTMVMAATFYSAVVFFSPGTLRWTGGTDTDWNNMTNWTVQSGTPSIPPDRFATGDHVIIDGAATFFPEITGIAFARSLTIESNARVTVKSGGALDVIGSDVDGVTNSGLIIVESMASMTIDSAFDDGLVNLTGAKVINRGEFIVTNGFGSRIENQDSIINSGTFYVNPGVDTAVINFNTGVIKNTGSFFIFGGNSSQLANYGRVLNESNTFNVTGGIAGILILNRAGSLIQNAGTFSVHSGFDRRIDNAGTITNSFIFQINGAVAGEGLVNHSSGLITNTAGTFSISSGTATQLDNYGTVSNSATFNILGGSAGNSLINRAGAVVDNLAGSMDLSWGSDTELDNSGTVNNYSTFTITGGGGPGIGLLNNSSGIFNHFSGLWTASSGNGVRVDNSGLITLHADATFTSGPGNSLNNNLTGTIDHYFGRLTNTSFSGIGFKNDGTYHGGAASSISIIYGDGVGISNTGTFIDTAGCLINIQSLNGDLIWNAGLMHIDCIDTLFYGSTDGIHNTSTGVFRQNLGSIAFSSFGSDYIENDNYFYANVTMNEADGGTLNLILNNKDSMILGANSSLTVDNTSGFVFNSGFLDNAGPWNLSGSGNTVINNSGTAIFRATASLIGGNTGGHVITNAGRFYNDGFIHYRDFAPSLLFNTNYFNNAGTLQGGLFGGGLINQDSLINSGTIEIDTTGANGLSNTGFFLNDTSGVFYADYIGQNGIFNDVSGIVKNNGALWMARDTGISQFAILNLGLFDNCSLINIGQRGPLFGGGIHNSTGLFSNLTGGEIYIYNTDIFGILNDNLFFNSCAYIETEGIIRDNHNFTNEGVIRKVIDNNALASNILVNNHIVNNEDPDPFIIGTDNGLLLNMADELLQCDNDMLFADVSGGFPALPLDSILTDTIPDGLFVLINGIQYLEGDSLNFECENLGLNGLFVQIIDSCSNTVIDSCNIILSVLDSFPKNLLCNDLVNVSLGEGCLKIVTTDDVLENIMGCRTVLYDVELVYPFGTHRFLPANDLLDESHIGYTMVYNVYETLTGNSCWGYLKVEDKLPPILNCTNDTIPCYVLPTLPLLAENEDDCYDGKVELVSDEWFEYGCDSVFLGYVIRTIQGTDRWGNFRRCESILTIERTELDSVVCPDVVELPCEIRTQIGGGKTLKTPITVDQSKVTPAYLLSLQKKTWEFTDNSKDWILNPSVQVVPQIDGQNIWPGAGGICKINAIFKDTRLDVCGAGFKIYREWIITDWCTQEERTCGQYIKVTDTEEPVLLTSLNALQYNASAHDCVASVTIPAIVAGKDFRDCNLVDQTYILSYSDPSHPGKIVVLTGTLPSIKLSIPVGEYKVEITLTDKCQNRTLTSRFIRVYDITPPTPVCDEFTQVTVDPVTCWAKIKAKDLDNGSRDNCCDVLHFAAAHMDSITYWRKYWTDTLEARCGKAEFWASKVFYEYQIEQWINAYVFKDEIGFSECGTSQVVLRVYEACGVPVYDPHVWPCTEHQWFWYNTDQKFRIEHNWNFFHKDGPKDCNYKYRIQCFDDYLTRGNTICEFSGNVPKPGGLCFAQYLGAVESLLDDCNSDFYFGAPANSSEANPPGNYCSERLYSDCMINVLIDDKQAPVVAELEDVLVYCDRAPDYASRPNCEGGDEYLVWPGLLQDSKGVEHGYYGGSDFLGIHQDEHETADACGYDNAHHWAPIYCRSWLYVDSFDAAGQIDPKQYFETLVLFDKTRPARTLLAKEFSITDNCRLNDTTLKVTDEGSLNGCGEGWIQRTWTIRDKCDNPITVRQKVVVKHRSDFEVIFPEDKVVECDFLNTTDPEDAGTPIISDDECEQVGVQYKDEVFTVEDSACYKIVRTWTLIDWCIYNPNADRHYSDVIVDDRLRADTGNRSCVYRHLKDNNDGYMKYIQVIKVIDKVAPVVTTRDTTICIYGEDCKSTLVRIPFSGTDNCTASSELSYRVEVDLNVTESVFTNRTYVKTSIDMFTQSNPTEFVYSPSVAGKHVVHVIVKDNCGNEDTSSYRFELKDCKKPTPYCYNGIATVIMPSTGKITVWAKDLDAGSFDNCTLADKLKFSFSAISSESSKEFSCTDIPDGKSKTIPVEIWVTDEAGNQDHCTTYILLQDNSGNACPDVAGLSVTIAGTIQTETKEPVEHVRVNIYGGAVQMNYQTGVKGTYHFEGLPSKSNYSLKSSRDDQPMNGISTLDLVLIQKHILGIELLDSPYKILAADIDNDKQITAIDLVELRKLILATYEDLPNNESWRFIPKSTTFSDKLNPWNAGAVSEVLEMKEVTTDYKSEDFIGLKVGDVNATAAPHSLIGIEVRGNETGLLFEINDQIFKRGDVVRVDFRSPNFRGISGWQGTLNVSDQLSVVSGQMEPGVLNLTNQNIGMRYAAEGKITMSWNTNAKSGLDIDDQQVLFTLVFKAQENGRLSEVLRIGSQHTIAESYEGKGELGNLGIRFVQNGNEILAKSELYQNYPNPFDQRTVIGINLANQGKGTLKVYDATGRTIKSVEREWTKGYHEVWFDRKEIGATGVLYYRFESGFFNASKKMIIVD